MASDATLRLFVAVYPPVEAARALLEAARKIDMPRAKFTAEAQVHLTLQFIGDRAVAELDEVTESVRRSAAGLEAFELRAVRLMTLPERGPARLIACETTGPAPLLEAHRRLAHRLARSPRERSADRFTPHLTLARFVSPAKVRVNEALDGPAFRVGSIALMRSVLKPEGAEHREIARVELG